MQAETTLKLIIAGCRDFTNYQLLREMCESVIGNRKDVVVLSGGATGADYLGERFAREKHYLIRVFNANWFKHGKAAGPLRNEEMAKEGNYLIAFWDGKSKGTKNMIETAQRYGINTKVVRY